MHEILLCDMKKGDEAVIKKLFKKGPLRKRLLDIGFIEGTKVRCVRISPAGDPKAYLVRGTVIAIRNGDAKNIIVEAAE